MQYTRTLTNSLVLDIDLLSRHNHKSVIDDYADATSRSEFKLVAVNDERLASIKVTGKASPTFSYLFGAEAAVNSRDSALSFALNGTAQILPSENVQVEERREEYFTQASWQATRTQSIELGLKAENSTISVKNSTRSKALSYLKPSLQWTWVARSDLSFSLRGERTVGQLDFEDFASSVSLQDAVIKAGNPDLVPETAWTYSLSADYKFWDTGALTLSAEHSSLDDVVDYLAIVTDEGVFNARGNIGEGTRDSFVASLGLPMDRLRLRNGLLKINLTLSNSDVIDPVTGLRREISLATPVSWGVNYSQKLSDKLSYGFSTQTYSNTRRYNATELYRFKDTNWTEAWLQYKPATKIAYTATIRGPFGWRNYTERYSWVGLRDRSAPALQEYTVARMPVSAFIAARREF